MKFLTERGHIAFGVVWTFAMLAMIIGLSGQGSVVYLPWLLLILPFAAARWLLRQKPGDPESVRIQPFLYTANIVVELTMVGILIYLYSVSLLTLYCANH